MSKATFSPLEQAEKIIDILLDMIETGRAAHRLVQRIELNADGFAANRFFGVTERALRFYSFNALYNVIIKYDRGVTIWTLLDFVRDNPEIFPYIQGDRAQVIQSYKDEVEKLKLKCKYLSEWRHKWIGHSGVERIQIPNFESTIPTLDHKSVEEVNARLGAIIGEITFSMKGRYTPALNALANNADRDFERLIDLMNGGSAKAST